MNELKLEMDKRDKKRRRSVRLLSQTEEIEKALIDNFEAKYGSVWKDFSPDYVSSRRKSMTGRRSGIHKTLPLPVINDDDLETDDISVHNRFDSPELLRAPDNLSADNSLNGKENTSAVTPNLMVPENDQSSSKTPEEILKMKTPKSYAGQPVKDFSITPDNVEMPFETEFESPDYPEGILIGQNEGIDLYQSPIMSERYSQKGIPVTPKYKKVDNEFRTPCAILRLNDSLPYSPSQPVFSTPSLNLPKSNSETPFSSHSIFDRVENSSVSSPCSLSESEMTESCLDICSETFEKKETANQTAPKQELSSRKLSNKKVNKTENLESSGEKLERERKETSTFLSICKSLASKIVNVVRKSPENDTDKPTENLENTIQDFFPATEVIDTIEDKTHFDVNCETKLVFECEKETCVSDMPLNKTTITKKIEDSANHELLLTVSNKPEKSNNEIINKCNKHVKLKNPQESLGKERTVNKDAESKDTSGMISSHCHTESLSDNNNAKSFTLLKSVGNEKEGKCYLGDFNSNSKQRAVSEKKHESNVQKNVHLLSNDARSERGVVTDNLQIPGQICSNETDHEANKAPKKTAIKKQSKAKRLSIDSHIMPDISSGKLSHDADAKDEKLKKKKSSTARRRSADPVLLARMSEKFGDKAGPSWTCAQQSAVVKEVNEQKKDTSVPSLEEEIPKKKRGRPAKRNSDIGLSKLSKQDPDFIDNKDCTCEINLISDKSKKEEDKNKDNILKGDVPKKKKGRPARRKSADPIMLSHISKDIVCNDDGICLQRSENNEDTHKIDSKNTDINKANISSEVIKVNQRKSRAAGKKSSTSVKLSQIVEEAGDDRTDSGNSFHGSAVVAKDFESVINDNVTSHGINEVDKRGIETEQLAVSETEDPDKNITEREILLNHVNSADFDRIQEFLSMDEEKLIVKSSKSRRRSADTLTLSDSASQSQQSQSQQDGSSDIPLRRTTRIKRRSIEIYQAGDNYQNNELESFSDSPHSQEDNNSPGTSSSGVKAKPARKRKMKEENVEDIYRNKNYKRPDDRVWETIFECPDELKNPDQLLSKKRFKRSIAFESIMPTKIKKRTKKAVDNGWDAKRRKKQQLPDEFVIEKLAELDTIFNS
ncbi:unnamed protein product [Mytilus edulis]|uniref:Tantalus-like domain-containing protein n=1 Tax=Mytilus edulis TaxID=6550 RepID=A0A8S3SW85_MYTED|nr:unnamed protein product [Mytilus edulis]